MRKIIPLLLLLFMTQNSLLWAQKSAIYTHELEGFSRAVELYKNKQYASAQLLFDQVKRESTTTAVQADCAYFAAHCAIRLSQPNADLLMEQFVRDYPSSSKQNQAYFEVAQYFFESGAYAPALTWIQRVDESNLSYDELARFYFEKAYCLFVSGAKKEAAGYFAKGVNSKEFGTQSKYYLGYMAYDNEDYTQANAYFKDLATEEKYKEKLSYYQAEMQFKQGAFQSAVDLALSALPKATAVEQSQLHKIAGESYFNLKQYDLALPHLKEYRGKKGKWNNTDFYQLGYTYYKQQDYTNAISQFNKIIDGKDAVAQNAYYHLGESYLKLDQKPQALNAFKNASELVYDLKIQEDAYLNYARLSYDIGNSYQAVPDVLQQFISKYPNSASLGEVQTILIDSYVSSKNYQGALLLLDKYSGYGTKEVYQKVSFYCGLQQYTDGNFQEAKRLFEKSIATGISPVYVARATFWKAEIEYVTDNFQESLLSFKQFESFAEAKSVPEFKNSAYHLAYVYFKLKEYEQAATYFQNYVAVAKDDKVRLNDAYLRLGDCRFVTTKYWPAMDAYNKVMEFKGLDADYAAYQKAISYGFVSKNDRKIEDLVKCVTAYPKSQYRDDVYFELGNTYVTEKKTDLAIKAYDQLIAEYPSSSYASKALLRQGLVYYNAEKDAQALLKFKKIAADYPRSAEALEAVSTARLIYVDNGKVDEYAQWVKTLDFVEITDADLDNDTYESAEKQYLQNDSKQAIAALSSYVAKFPTGIHSLKANFYLAQAYFGERLTENAIPHYEFVVAKPRNEYTEQALARLGEIYIKKSDAVTAAIAALKRLEAEADFPQNVVFAQSNLMKIYYEQKDYANAVVYAEKVLSNPKMDSAVKSDAQIIVARSAFEVNDEAKARVAYAKLLSLAKGELAAEALYYDAYFKNKDGQYEASNLAVQQYTKAYSGYKYFGAKALVVMAKNFYALKDSFQATYILESITKNFVAFPNVVQEAEKELAAIKLAEAQTNSSIKN